MRTLPRLSACVVFASVSSILGQTFVQGTVYNPFGIPVRAAQVTCGGQSATTDTNGVFYLGSPILGTRRPLSEALPKQLRQTIRLNGWRVAFFGAKDRDIRLELFDAMGRTVFSADRDRDAGDVFTLDIRQIRQLPAGMYVLRAQSGDRTYMAKAMVTGPASVAWQPARISEAAKQENELARVATGALSISATDLASRAFNISQDVAIGLEFTLYYPGQAEPAGGVDILDTSETTNLSESFPVPASYPMKWAGRSLLKCDETLLPPNQAQGANRNMALPLKRLQNGRVRAVASPALGSRVVYLTDENGAPRDMFARPNTWADPHNQLLKGGKFSNIGGIKPSFPYAENTTGLLSQNFEFIHRAGSFTVTQPDGRISVMMNMRFDYNQREEDCTFLGKFGDRPLLTTVSLEPGKSYMTLTQVAENPHPLRRNNRIWNDAIMPFSPDLYIYPTRYATSHCANDPDVAHAGYIDVQALGPITSANSLDLLRWGSYFALFPQYGFAGAYYSAADACHLRVADPSQVPGTKLYAHYDIPELWSSTNTVFEAPDTFVAAWEPVTMTTRWYMTRGIGVVEYASEYVAISINSADKTFKLTSPCPGIVSVLDYNQDPGSASAKITDSRIGPDTVLTGSYSVGLRVYSMDGKELCNVPLPLTYEDNSATYADVKHKADLDGCVEDLASTPNTRFEYHYELEEVTASGDRMSSLASLLAVNNVTSADNADYLLSMARAAYRVGGFGVVQQYLGLVGSSGDVQQANFLRALMKIERDSIPDLSNVPIEGNYFRALAKIASGDRAGAISELDALLSSRPNAVRPRILRSYLKSDLIDASIAYRSSPSSLELWVALKAMGYPGANDRLNGLLQQDAVATTRANDFLSEITTGHWRAERRYEYDNTWFENVSLPAFPTYLKY
jgi:hypothetical protein